MRSIFGLAIVLVLFMSLVGTGSWAFFTDPENSGDNAMSAGSLDLKTDDANGVTQTIYATNMKRGDSVSGNITLKNVGTKDGTTLDIAFSYVENDDTPNSVNMGSDVTAATMEVTMLNYDGSNLLNSVSDNNTNGYKDVQDLKNADLTGQNGLDSQNSKDFEIALKLKESTDNGFQGDGIIVSITFILNQLEL